MIALPLNDLKTGLTDSQKQKIFLYIEMHYKVQSIWYLAC